MTKTTKILNNSFAGEIKAIEQLELYLKDIEQIFDLETTKEIQASVVEKLSKYTTNDIITTEVVEKIKTEIGTFERTIYKKFYRTNGWFAGVCAGLAQYFSLKVWIIRFLFVFPMFVALSVTTTMTNFFLYDPTPFQVLFIIHEIVFTLSFWIATFYVLSFIIVPKAKTELQKLEIKGYTISDEILLQAVKNKLNYKNNFFGRIVAKILYFIAKVGIFIFDFLVQMVNNFATLSSVILLSFSSLFLLSNLIALYKIIPMRFINITQQSKVNSPFFSSDFFKSDLNFWFGLGLIQVMLLSWFIFSLLWLLKNLGKFNIKKLVATLGILSISFTAIFVGLFLININQIQALEKKSTHTIQNEMKSNVLSLESFKYNDISLEIEVIKSPENKIEIYGNSNTADLISINSTDTFDFVNLNWTQNGCYFCNENIKLKIYSNKSFTLISPPGGLVSEGFSFSSSYPNEYETITFFQE